MARLTVKSVEAWKPEKTRREVPDAYTPGLYFIVQPSGVKSWAVRYRHSGKAAKLTLGPYPAVGLKAARDAGTSALRAVAEGRDPRAERKKPAAVAVGSVEAAVEQFIARHVARKYRPKPRKGAERYLRGHVLEKWSGRKIASISRADVRALVEPLVDVSPIAANRLHSIVRTFFAWLLDQDIIAASPCAGLKPPAGREPARDRVLADPELRRVWLAAEQIGAPYGVIVQLLALTGQRRGEVAGMRWDELDLEQCLWTLPAERTKNKRRHEVPLPPQAVEIIKGLSRIGDYVFTYDGDAAVNCWDKIEDLRALVGDIPQWTLHDLRRTAASGMARLGVNLPVIERALNHVSGSFAGIVGVYQRHEFAEEKRTALQKWADHVERLVR
jgi:integrase